MDAIEGAHEVRMREAVLLAQVNSLRATEAVRGGEHVSELQTAQLLHEQQVEELRSQIGALKRQLADATELTHNAERAVDAARADSKRWAVLCSIALREMQGSLPDNVRGDPQSSLMSSDTTLPDDAPEPTTLASVFGSNDTVTQLLLRFSNLVLKSCGRSMKVPVASFRTDFCDSEVYLSALHLLFPFRVAADCFEQYRTDVERARFTCSTLNECGLPNMLSPADILQGCEPYRVMMLLSQLLNLFASPFPRAASGKYCLWMLEELNSSLAHVRPCTPSSGVVWEDAALAGSNEYRTVWKFVTDYGAAESALFSTIRSNRAWGVVADACVRGVVSRSYADCQQADGAPLDEQQKSFRDWFTTIDATKVSATIKPFECNAPNELDLLSEVLRASFDQIRSLYHSYAALELTPLMSQGSLQRFAEDIEAAKANFSKCDGHCFSVRSAESFWASRAARSGLCSCP